jgi:predicted TIM-barrel fold metal-dependent hydrolase
LNDAKFHRIIVAEKPVRPHRGFWVTQILRDFEARFCDHTVAMQNTTPRLRHRGDRGKHLPKEYIERRQIYFGFEVDEKLLPFAIEEFGDQCWVYGSDIHHGDCLYGTVDVFLKRDDISEESKRKLLIDNTTRFYGL